jgi:hypothetical protein
VIIDGQRKLAEAYAVYIMGVYNQCRWRYHQRQAERGQSAATGAAADAAPTWAGLVDDDTWQLARRRATRTRLLAPAARLIRIERSHIKC